MESRRALTLTRQITSVVAELFGLGALVVAAWMLATWAGLVVLGLALLLVGESLAPSPLRSGEQ